jgi:peptidoglycan/LPS O-acetylase OafA/YrhL
MRQLDGLRSVAVLIVMLSHYFAQYFTRAQWGRAGVILFFVLSGFLITRILMQARQRAEGGWRGGALCLRQFYIRRFLRIFPLYYFVVVLLVLAGAPGVRENAGYYFSYTVNLFCGLRQQHVTGQHFWSLCVEEQFYLLWPLVVLLTPRRRLPWVAGGMAVVAVASRWALVEAGFRWYGLYLPVCNLDSLGAGVLMAWLDERGSLRSRGVARYAYAIVPAAAVVWVAMLAFPFHTPAGMRLQVPLADLALTAMFFFLVAGAARELRGPGRVLGWGPLVYLGRISYGLYVYHLFMPAIRNAGLDALGVQLPRGVCVAIDFGLTIAVAALSWRLLERPINDLKRRFPYTQPRRQPQRPAPAPAGPRWAGAAN